MTDLCFGDYFAVNLKPSEKIVALTRFSLLTWVVSQGLQRRLFFTTACKDQDQVRWLLFAPPPTPQLLSFSCHLTVLE